MADDEETVPDLPIPRGTKRYHISEDDLSELERIIPQWASLMMDRLDTPERRTQFRRVQRILTDDRARQADERDDDAPDET